MGKKPKCPFPKPSWEKAVRNGLLVDVTPAALKAGFRRTTYFSAALFERYPGEVETILEHAKSRIVGEGVESDKLNLLYKGEEILIVLHALEDGRPRLTLMLLEEYR